MALRLAIVYAVVASLWIVFSDRLVTLLALPPRANEVVSSTKGLLFVIVTGLILWLLAVRWLDGLQASEERYLRLFENATEGLTVLRVVSGPATDRARGAARGGPSRAAADAAADLVIADINPALSARLHATRAAVVGRRFSERAGLGERLRAHLEFVQSAVAEGEPARSELYLPSDGLYELLLAYPIGHGLWALAALDVTDVREAEQALRRQQEGIRQAYVDVLDAVTGGKLVLLDDDALQARLGMPLTDARRLDSAAELADARRVITAAAAGQDAVWASDGALLSPVCEALNNALKHAGGGSYQVFERKGRLQVAVADEGPGIDFRTLPKATLVPGFSTIASLGMGFAIMLQLSERVLLSTGPGHTVVVLEMPRHPRERRAHTV
jgi:anti-sigma regulatory factor (Ser/Thr protein kinase)